MEHFSYSEAFNISDKIYKSFVRYMDKFKSKMNV